MQEELRKIMPQNDINFAILYLLIYSLATRGISNCLMSQRQY